jgi:hypothetical protein
MLMAGAIVAAVAGCKHGETTVSTPSDNDIVKDKLVDVGAEAIYKIFPRARPTSTFAGGIVAPSLYMSSGPLNEKP